MLIGKQFYFQMDKNEKYELKTVHDYNQISKEAYHAAKGFYIISQRCCDMLLREYNDQICSNIAFSCELYLKSILLRNKIDCRKEHDLYQLYKLLPTECANEIVELYSDGEISKDVFELYLKEIGNTFIVLRYVYERKRMACNLRFLLQLIILLDNYCSIVFENKE